MKINRRKITGAVVLAAAAISCLVFFNVRVGAAGGTDVTNKSTVSISINQGITGRALADVDETTNASQEPQVVAQTSSTSITEAPKAVEVKTSQPAAKVSTPVKKAEPVKIASRGSSPQPSVKAASAPAAASSRGMDVVNTAKRYLGVPYVYGAAGPGSFDCSGLTMYVYAKFGINLPHNASAQSQLGQYVPKAQLQPGDLVFFATDGTGRISHVGIYIGGGNFINAPRTGENVNISSMANSYYMSKYVTARRVIH